MDGPIDNAQTRRQTGARLALTLTALLGACVSVPPAPIDVPARAAARTTAALNLPAIHARAVALAPGAPSVTQGLDRLTLFAALLEHDPKVAEARAALESARRDARAARKAGSPTFSLTSEYANDPSTSSPWLIGGAVDLPLDIGGRRSARLGRADLAVLAARYDLAETIWAERMALHRALVDVFAGQQQATLGTQVVALRDRQLAVLEDRARRGEIAGLDLYPYRAQRAQAARMADDARARAFAGRAAVAGTLGVPVAALEGTTLDWSGFGAPSPAPAILPAPDRSRSIAGRADVLHALAAYDQAEADLRGEVAKQYPAISLGPGYTWERGLVKLPFALNLALPSWDRNHAAISAAEAKRAQAAAAIETTLAAAQAAIESAEAEWRAATAALIRMRAQELPQTAAVAARADTQLRLGAIGRADWGAAHIAALEAQLAEIDALVRVRTAEAALEDALRRPLDGPETRIDPKMLERLL